MPEDERLMAEVKAGSVAALSEQTRYLHDLFSQIPDAQREIVSLAFYGRLSHMEIAAVLDLPARTVKGRMRLGLHELRGWVDRAPPKSFSAVEPGAVETELADYLREEIREQMMRRFGEQTAEDAPPPGRPAEKRSSTRSTLAAAPYGAMGQAGLRK